MPYLFHGKEQVKHSSWYVFEGIFMSYHMSTIFIVYICPPLTYIIYIFKLHACSDKHLRLSNVWCSIFTGFSFLSVCLSGKNKPSCNISIKLILLIMTLIIRVFSNICRKERLMKSKTMDDWWWGNDYGCMWVWFQHMNAPLASSQQLL